MTTEELKYAAIKIKKKRTSMGLSQEEMAEKLDISYSYYSKIENAVQTPSLDVMIKIATTMHLSLDKLIFQKEESEDDSPEAQELLHAFKTYDRSHLITCRDLLDRLIEYLE